MRRVWVVLMVCTLARSVVAQWDSRSVASAGMIGLSDTSMHIGEGNPALPALLRSVVLKLGVVPSPFGLHDLRRIGAALAGSLWGWGLELHLLRYGADLFRDSRIRAGVSYAVSQNASIGGTLGISRWYAKGYPPITSWDYRTGVFYRDDPLRIGLRVKAEKGGLGHTRMDVGLGMSVDALPVLSITSEIVQEEGFPLRMLYRFRYIPLEVATIVLAWGDDPRILGTGVQFLVGFVEVEYGTNWHSVLGWTHGFGLSMRL